MVKRRYRFIGRFTTRGGVDYYVWYAMVPNDSRVEEIKCPVEYFWAI